MTTETKSAVEKLEPAEITEIIRQEIFRQCANCRLGIGFDPEGRAHYAYEHQLHEGLSHVGIVGCLASKELRELLGRLSTAPLAPEQQWQDISSAPKNGKVILGFCDKRICTQGVVKAMWSSRKGFWASPDGAEGYDLTHWMPLPAAPGQQSARSICERCIHFDSRDANGFCQVPIPVAGLAAKDTMPCSCKCMFPSAQPQSEIESALVEGST